MTLEKTATSYRVGISVEEMKAILRYDKAYGEERVLRPTLRGRLGEVPGVSRINYDGRFGPVIFFTLDANLDIPRRQTCILARIRKHIKVCKKQPEVSCQ
jgi:hypothetical protein